MEGDWTLKDYAMLVVAVLMIGFVSGFAKACVADTVFRRDTVCRTFVTTDTHDGVTVRITTTRCS